MLQPIFPNKLQSGDMIRVIAPSRSLGMINGEIQKIANDRLARLGFRLTFGQHVEEVDDFVSSSVESRVADIHDAFADPEVKGILTVIGGFNTNQLLDALDWDVIQQNPKVFCGYSDITALNNAIFAKTGLVTYSGPHYSTFGQKKHFDYTLEYFKKVAMEKDSFVIPPSRDWSDDQWYLDQENRTLLANDGYWVINEGEASGVILGANLCTFNLLQGTQYMPLLAGSVLFIEDDYESQPHHFDRDLQSLIHQPGFSDVRGLVIGRFQKKSNMSRSLLEQCIKTKPALDHIPTVANVDFGHTDPKITIPIGGEIKLRVGKHTQLEIVKH